MSLTLDDRNELLPKLLTDWESYRLKIGQLPPEGREIPMGEKRKDERFDLCLSATILVISKNVAEKGKVLHLLTKDICLGGSFFVTSKLLPVGTEVRIQIVLPLHMLKTVRERKALLRVEKGVVLRHESNGMAIEFEKGREIAHPEPFIIH